MEPELIRAGLPDRDLLFRLLQYSLYEESAHDGNEMGKDGLFAYPWFDGYFTDPVREAYLVRTRDSGTLLGFAMVHPYPRSASSLHSIAEFLVLPPYRRQGIGRAAARACFQAHPGAWEIAPSLGSEGAFRFWQRVIAAYTGKAPEIQGSVFRFSADTPLTNAADTI